MAHYNTRDYDTWSKIAKTRYHAAKLRQRAIEAESCGNEALAVKFMSLADCVEHKCDREQLRVAISGRR